MIALFNLIRDIKGSALSQQEVDAINAALAGEPIPEMDSEGFDFTDALAIILKHEGGYVNHPRDPGGRTNLGVTQRVWEAWIGRKATEADMRGLKQSDVQPLYERNYWQASGADRLPIGIALCVFDFAVNSGPARAVRYLQLTVGATADGRFGPQTLAEVLKDVRDFGEADVVRRYQAKRESFYRSLRTFPTFGRGWLRRNNETTAKALEIAG